ncbi:MAG: cytochrome c oxidase subunit II [Gammaproteobacteria bacterium]
MRGRKKPNRGRAAFGAGLASLGPAAAWAEMRVNLPEGVTSISREVYDLHMLILAICAAMGVLLFAVMFYSIYAHRRSKGAVAVQFHENALVEIVWTVVPFVILVAMAVPATKSMIALYDTADADVTVKVTGYQWKWQYEYLEDGIKFVSNLKTPSEQIYDGAPKGENYLLEVDNPLVLPVNKKVRFLITAADVLHAWWVPDFGWKQDATPGFVNEGWARIEKPGTYRGQCAELCGRGHGFMPIVVDARSEAEYAEWVEERKEELAAAEAATAQTFTMEQLMEEGAKVYNASCTACHQAKGEGVPGAFPPIAGSAIAKGPVGAHIDIVLKGRPNTAMLPFSGQLDDLHIAAVVTYQRNAFGNAVGDRVQPADVKAARGR